MNSDKKRKLLVVQVAGLGFKFLSRFHGAEWIGMRFKSMKGFFPALTCPVQATFRTGKLPSEHGMIANGCFARNLMKPMFWEQSAGLVKGERIWDQFRERGKKVAMLFWQQSLGENADIILSPAPIHKHHGGMLQDCYSKPAGLYSDICTELGRSFDLKHYWGPMASAKVSEWIVDATCHVLSKQDLAPDVCFTYLPTLDYDLQRFGPEHQKSKQALDMLMDQLETLFGSAQANGYDLLVYGDYAIDNCSSGAVFPNRLLRGNGLFTLREVNKMLYPDMFESRAFAMVDHEIAHLYIKDNSNVRTVKGIFQGKKGIKKVLDSKEQAEYGIANEDSGELVLITDKGYWFAYPWWKEDEKGPEYAGHVDIHNKPGYDPCELFFGWPPGTVSRNTAKIKGSHGTVDDDRDLCWLSTFVDSDPETLVDLSLYVKSWLEGV